MLLPLEIINKILLWNIHPVAEILKPVFLKSKEYYSILEYIREFKKFCFYCHRDLTLESYMNISDTYYICCCDSELSNPNDDIYHCNQFELLDIRIIESKIKYQLYYKF